MEVETVKEVEVSALNTQLAIVSKALVEIDEVGAGIADLRTKYLGLVFDVATTIGLDEAKAARMAIREPRFKLEHIRKKAKRPILDLGQKLDSEAERITNELLALENPIHSQIAAQELLKENEKKAKAEAERKRVEAIHARIEAIRESVAEVAGLDSQTIEEKVRQVVAVEIDETFAEFKQQAVGAKDTTLIRLRALQGAALSRENEQKRLAEERAEFAREQEAARIREATERDAAAEAERARKAAQDAEDVRIAEQRQRQKEEDDRQAAARKALLDAEQKRLDDARIEADRVKTAQDARDAEAAEQRRLENESSERARQRGEAALQEISAMQHQLLIAEVGRAPYCKGGDLESYDWVIGNTEDWTISQEKFGVLTASAQRVKDSTLATLRKQREELVDRLQRNADADAEQKRLTEAREAIERQQAELKASQERAAEPPVPIVTEMTIPASVSTESPVEMLTDSPPCASFSRPSQPATPAVAAPWRPTDDEIIHVVATSFFVPESTAADWLASMDIHQSKRSAA